MEKIALCKLGHLEDGDPVELGCQLGDVARRFPNADILGGCCGTDERHMGEIAKKGFPSYNIHRIHIRHPSYHHRGGGANDINLEYRKDVELLKILLPQYL